ncbi:tRNA pseudouridine(38/39) synthase isoform X2 [Phlebotomus papatasi]|uniref:tRNA pseudouridine(38/39) synthase isoform X2 n=1 Tax=Phlebotomus papatasi TaxID=29031 RepID=UPI002483C2D7|nr:tRNA pseudouridine(38/39) synthase isoform X2 [Phlebotomus papatasi]
MTTNKELCVNKRNKLLSKEELEGMSKEELIDKVIQLQAHNLQLKNIIQKRDPDGKISEESPSKKKRKFDFSKAYKRHILLKFLYLGWDYQGYASQEDSVSTIEYHLFRALEKTCLIEKRENANYHRCGRTDKGVSAFSQTISIDVRSKFPPEDQMLPESLENELNYCVMLNQSLPDDIRCISWHPLEDDTFSARFNCQERSYRYFFPRGKLSIPAMREGCVHLQGSHDFRNLCKMDVANGVVSFTRTIESAVIKEIAQDGSDDPHSMMFLEIKSNAFLWHQIRCIMSVLLLIGLEKEKPEVILELLNVQKNPRKPQYSLASDVPLNLYETSFEDKDSWVLNQQTLERVIRDLETQWMFSSIKTTMMLEMAKDLKRMLLEKFPEASEVGCSGEELIQGAKMKNYKRLMERSKGESLEDRIEHYVKKRRLNVNQQCYWTTVSSTTNLS